MIGMMLNYREFYSPALLQPVFLWQDYTGCFTEESMQPQHVKTTSKQLGRRLMSDEIVDGKRVTH